jgi:hypothetical protein
MKQKTSTSKPIKKLRINLINLDKKEIPERSNFSLIKDAYCEMLKKYAPYVTTAATLTFKASDMIVINKRNKSKKYDLNDLPESSDLPEFRFRAYLDDYKITSSLTYFTSRMNHYCFGKASTRVKTRDESRLLILFFIEGDGIRKHKHVHVAIGNIPDKYVHCIEHIIKKAWSECDFSNSQQDVRPAYNAQGWLNYELKEVGYGNTDVFNVVHSCIPRSIENSVCT